MPEVEARPLAPNPRDLWKTPTTPYVTPDSPFSFSQASWPPPSPLAQAPPKITTPLQEFGHNFGDDYFLANYKQIAAYWQKLDRESDRMTLQSIGKTAEGRDQLMAIVTSPANHKNLAALPGDLAPARAGRGADSEAEARALAREGKAVVWIDGGLHANESLGAQQLGEMVYQMVSRTDDETMRILDDVIILFVHANPDGNDLVADWYMRNPEPEQRSPAQLPRLYQKYIGHDNNRDFFASTQLETENMNRVLYREWFPQILYNHHQSGPAGHGAVVAAAARSVQLQPGPAARARHPDGRHRAAHAARRRRQAGRDDAIGRRRTTAGGTAACATPRRSTTRSRSSPR